MPYLLRYVQQFRAEAADEFIDIERQFMRLESEDPLFPKGKRYTACFSAESQNTLVWECEFPTLGQAISAHEYLAGNEAHAALFAKQARLIISARAEIYQPLEDAPSCCAR
jgi:hypothetical protein